MDEHHSCPKTLSGAGRVSCHLPGPSPTPNAGVVPFTVVLQVLCSLDGAVPPSLLHLAHACTQFVVMPSEDDGGTQKAVEATLS